MENSKSLAFTYRTRVAFHATDAMGVVHHSNHIKYYEEARVAWMRERGLIDVHHPYGPLVFAVVDLRSRYMKTARFDDALEVRVEVKAEGLRILFRYAIWNERTSEWISEGETTLVPINDEMRPTRLPENAREVFGREPWSATWPPEVKPIVVTK